MKQVTLVIILFLLSTTVFSETRNARGFLNRFDLLKQGEQVVAITDKSLSLNINIKKFIKRLKSDLLQEQAKMKQKGNNYYKDANKILFGDVNLEKSNEELPAYMQASLKEIEKMDIEKIFSNPKFKEVISQFEVKLTEIMLPLQLNMIAKLEDPTFFYKRNVTHQVVVWALNFAKKKLGQIPVLNIASFVIVEVEKLIRERRTYHQNILLYYFNNFNERDLGLTKVEVDKAFSSIYESRIPWFNFWESKRAQADWENYGASSFFTGLRIASRTLRTNRSRYESVGERLNFAFQDVTVDGKKVIVNLFNNESLFKYSPAITLEYDRPKYVMRRRGLLRIVQVGMSFISLPNFIKNIVNSYIESTYVTQRITEGALYGYFESTGNEEMKRIIAAQSMNPFESLQ